MLFRRMIVLLSVFLGMLLLPRSASAQSFDQPGTFGYQGYLQLDGTPVNGSCSMTFSLWDAPTAGTQVGTTQNLANVTVNGGVFSVNLNFGVDAFNVGDRYLETAVDCGTGAQTLNPRQPLTAAPLANALPYFTTDAQSYNIIGGQFPTVTASDNATVAGGRNNVIDNSNFGTIAGGYDNELTSGDASTIGGGFSNDVSGRASVIAGGYSNEVYDNYSTIGGGFANVAGSDDEIVSSGDYATVAGGYLNEATEDSSFVGGGYANQADAYIATIAGGAGNQVFGEYGFIGGGGPSNINAINRDNNVVYDDYGVVAGGGNNQAGSPGNTTTNAPYATVGGGQNNVASQDYATVPGGRGNQANAPYAFAAGRSAVASDTGAFVWADSVTDAPFFSTAPNQFRVLASGGVQFYSGTGTGVSLAANGTGWRVISDRNLKSEVKAVNTAAVLEAVVSLPVSEWQFTDDDDGRRYIGPMAQDFHAAFGLGEDDTTINSVDMDGVTLAAIQGLNAEVEALREQVAVLEREVNLRGAGMNGLAIALVALLAYQFGVRRREDA